jgi:hypothetical protein
VHKIIISAVKRVEFVSDRMSYIILRDRCCYIIILNVHAPTEHKTDSFYKVYQMKILLGNFNAEVGREKQTNSVALFRERSVPTKRKVVREDF